MHRKLNAFTRYVLIPVTVLVWLTLIVVVIKDVVWGYEFHPAMQEAGEAGERYDLEWCQRMHPDHGATYKACQVEIARVRVQTFTLFNRLLKKGGVTRDLALQQNIYHCFTHQYPIGGIYLLRLCLERVERDETHLRRS